MDAFNSSLRNTARTLDRLQKIGRRPDRAGDLGKAATGHYGVSSNEQYACSLVACRVFVW